MEDQKEDVNLIILFSGKRKSGKDFVSNFVYERLKEHNAVQIRLSGPIKFEYAKAEGLDYEELLTDSGYKEDHRLPMIKWSENIRRKDTGIFIRSALEMYKADQFKVWIVCDIRRITDLEWFKSHFGNKVLSVRISAPEKIRSERGFVYIRDIDDAESECDLDSITNWDLQISNDSEDTQKLENISEFLSQKCADS